ncbi:MAG: hypothetical protein EWV80_09520 [Microcystis aeruginosa Ma_QC_B_20070730_S2]|uniref:Uncharacterized protein n=1 Tax=Microcystis aeruginosa Ma_QC_B_20070730_S2 TaxID=2486256 RepID=A0A552DTF0_MICAE|nr:MAG: hypothetical protein EWV65_18230 [Microcystis flos-aquae Ma_QC_C_20070823_S18D]TRU25530.1 MAG: hypothetical protein EWV80_09520 [Microcystis aeruginosa Ma_QC_B_20070730_S2]
MPSYSGGIKGVPIPPYQGGQGGSNPKSIFNLIKTSYLGDHKNTLNKGTRATKYRHNEQGRLIFFWPHPFYTTFVI